MPLLIKLDQIRPGAALAEPFMQNGQLLLSANRPLSPREIDAVKERCPGGHVKIVEPVLDEFVEFEDDSAPRLDIQERLTKITKLITPTARRLKAGKPITDIQLRDLRQEIRRYTSRWRQPKMIIIDPGAAPLRFHRPARLILFALALGGSLKAWISDERERLTVARRTLDVKTLNDLEQLATAALLANADALAEEEVDTLHPMSCLTMLPDKLPPLVHAALTSHHEDFAGGGQPKGTPASEMHVFARVLRVADAFEMALAESTPTEALRQIVAGAEKQFDPTLTDRMRALIQPVAVGTRARLKDGRVAVIVGYNPKDGLDPKIFVAYDRRGRRLSRAEMEGPLHLSARDDLELQ